MINIDQPSWFFCGWASEIQTSPMDQWDQQTTEFSQEDFHSNHSSNPGQFRLILVNPGEFWSILVNSVYIMVNSPCLVFCEMHISTCGRWKSRDLGGVFFSVDTGMASIYDQGNPVFSQRTEMGFISRYHLNYMGNWWFSLSSGDNILSSCV